MTLRDKALLALEEVCADARYRAPPRTHAVRFALAYLWSLSNDEVAPFTDFWRELANWNELVRWRQADFALVSIYAAVGASRDEELMWTFWRHAEAARDARRAEADAAGGPSRRHP